MTTLHFIDGKDVPAASGKSFETYNPATGQVLATVALGEEEDVNRAVKAAWRSYESGAWCALMAPERARRLRRVGSLIRERLEEIAGLESKNNGKPLTAARGDVAAAADLIDYASTLPENVRSTVFTDQAGYFTYSRRVPYGVVGAIAAWNFPFLLAVWKTAFALAVGNSVVLKMAEQTPLTTSIYAHLCAEAGIPDGVVNVVHGDRTAGAALVQHPGVPKITFTGSTDVGKEILRMAASEVKSVHLELGGKSPNIVFADADMDQATAGSLFTSFFNSGQICTSGTRLLVDERVHDSFLEAFVSRAKAIKVGDPQDAQTQLGPLVSAAQLERVSAYIKEGVRAGAKMMIGGETPANGKDLEHGYYVSPTVFTNVEPQMLIAKEEIFGPVLSVLTFKNDQEAIALANAVPYGLAATVWTNRLDRAFTLAERLDAGIIWTNSPHHLNWNTPYEGHKMSGLGEDLGLEGINTFTRLKVNCVNFGGDKLTWA
jgi:acyl-CoA reductase-like NAD-dependent aldehyde dehydrogenase